MSAPEGESLLSLLPLDLPPCSVVAHRYMLAIRPRPTSWVTIGERGFGVNVDFRMCGLVDPAHVSEERARGRSRVRDVGEVELFDSYFNDGMTDRSD